MQRKLSKKPSDSGTTNKAKTIDAPVSAKPNTQARREKIQLTEKGQFLMKELGINDTDLLVGLLQQIYGASRKGAEVDHTDADFTLAFVKGGKPRDPIESTLETQMSVTHQAVHEIRKPPEQRRDRA